MTLLERIKKDRMDAMRARNSDKKNILTVLLGDIENRFTGAQEVSDVDVVAMVKKYISNIEDTFNHCTDIEQGATLTLEMIYLEEYLPKQLTKDEIRDLMISSGETNIGSLMKFMKENHAGKYDGGLAAEVAKSL